MKDFITLDLKNKCTVKIKINSIHAIITNEKNCMILYGNSHSDITKEQYEYIESILFKDI